MSFPSLVMIGAWWLVCFLMIVYVWLFFRHFNKPDYRDSAGESTEAGYFETSTGEPLDR